MYRNFPAHIYTQQVINQRGKKKQKKKMDGFHKQMRVRIAVANMFENKMK